MLGKNQKARLLILYDLLKLKTDEDHPLTTYEIIEELSLHNIICERRTIYSDIDDLNELGYEVMKIKVGRINAYYVEDRIFTLPELKILIDAIQAAGFITNKKTDEMISKILSLSSIGNRELLNNSMVMFNTTKHTNETVLYNVDSLEKALLQHKRVSFKYFKLDENANKLYQKDGNLYIVDPISLVYMEDYYYLVTYNAKYNDMTHYRVDRMESVEIIDELTDAITDEVRNNLGSYTEQIFKMYHGKTYRVILQFLDSVINPIFDKFGEGIEIIRINDEWYQTTLTVQDSPVFYGWLFNFSNAIKIVEPEYIKEEYKKKLRNTIKLYE